MERGRRGKVPGKTLQSNDKIFGEGARNEPEGGEKRDLGNDIKVEKQQGDESYGGKKDKRRLRPGERLEKGGERQQKQT